jgi:prepilin-type N-terminal cleavage/methylation domain-containing protein
MRTSILLLNSPLKGGEINSPFPLFAKEGVPKAGALSPLKGSRGFTLLELIIVIFLIALTFGISTVFFVNALPSGRFNATVRDLASSIRHARSLAQTEGTGQSVFIDIDSKKFGIEGKSPMPFPPDVNIKVIDPFSEAVVSGKYSFHFNPSGGSDGGEVVLWNTKKTVHIVLDPVVGSTVIKE